ncbi:MAG: protein translocase subunit SecD [Dehalococcoidales bacterium]|nr:MAG: protein translocase subunit SecD [Dehalococcoidales bacterium]
MRRNTWIFISVIIVFILAALVVFPFDEGILGNRGTRLGLDLVGGVSLVYKAEFPEGTSAEERAQGIDRALEVIRTRIDRYGVTEPTIQTLEVGGEESISVKLPGFTDIEEAKKLVKQTGFLEFKMVELDDEGDPVYLSSYLELEELEFFNEVEDGTRVFAEEFYQEGLPIAFLVKGEDETLSFFDSGGNVIDIEELKEELEAITFPLQIRSWIPARGQDGTLLTGEFLAEADARLDQSGGGMKVGIVWTEEGGDLFNEVAEQIYYSGPEGSDQRSVGIFLDDELLSAPQILLPEYSEGRGEITGQYTAQEAIRLANLLESGSLPMPLSDEPLYEDLVSATRGNISVDMGLKAGLIGAILVVLFMIIYYRIPGLLASLALVFYGVVVLALFKLIPVTLTLAGIGGFVLSLGMAVDANVLIFERMKEEMRRGRTLGAAIEAGFSRAWTAIRDSNVTTFIVCIILYWVGTSVIAGEPIMGFALTLFIGVAVSMLTAIVVTRTLLRLFVGTQLGKRTELFTPYSGRKNV